MISWNPLHALDLEERQVISEWQIFLNCYTNNHESFKLINQACENIASPSPNFAPFLISCWRASIRCLVVSI